jgi:hypothetical protein
MKDNFNSNFYITAAIVIPLLYITLFLQSQIIQNLSRSFLRVGAKISDQFFRKAEMSRRAPLLFLDLILLAALFVLLVLICLIIAAAFAGIVAEALSLWALYYQSDNVTMRAIALWSMLGLLVLVSANPLSLLCAIYSLGYSLSRERHQMRRPIPLKTKGRK